MNVAIIGAGGHAKVVYDAILSAEQHEVVGFVDDNVDLIGTKLYGLPIVGNIADLDSPALRDPENRGVEGYIIAIGNNTVRKEKVAFYSQAGYLPITVIHPRAVIAKTAQIGEGAVVFANVVVNPEARIGKHVILYTACTIDHECNIADYAYISPGCNVGGQVTIETGAFLGIGAVVLPRITVGAWSIIGAGAVVTKDIPGGFSFNLSENSLLLGKGWSLLVSVDFGCKKS
jgi:sugar O-acyltransferase (sialic acid O-acetyltransferase NeuD family)